MAEIDIEVEEIEVEVVEIHVDPNAAQTAADAAAAAQAALEAIQELLDGFSVPELDNIPVAKHITFSGAASEANFAAQINSLAGFEIDQKEIFVFTATNPTANPSLIPTQYKFLLNGKGKGNYGTGSGTTLTAADINILFISQLTPAGAASRDNTQEISLGEIGGTPVHEVLTDRDPAIAIQSDEIGYRLVDATVEGVKVEWFFVGAGATYGQGANPATAEMFKPFASLGAPNGDNVTVYDPTTDSAATLNEAILNLFYSLAAYNLQLVLQNGYGTTLPIVFDNGEGDNIHVDPLEILINNTVHGGGIIRGGTARFVSTNGRYVQIINGGVVIRSGYDGQPESGGEAVFRSDLVEGYLTLQAPKKTGTFTLATMTDLANDVGTAVSQLEELIEDEINAIKAIIGDDDPDGNSIVDTVAEILAVFENYPEGSDIAAVLAAKINTSDIVNNLLQVVSGKVLDAAQGKVLKDLIDGVAASLSSIETSLATYKRYLHFDGTSNTPVTGVTSLTMLKSGLIPANSIGVEHSFKVDGRIVKSGLNAAAGLYIYTNTSNSLTGATLLATSGVTSTGYWGPIVRTFVLKSGGQLFGFPKSTSAPNDFGVVSQTASLTSWDRTVDNYIILACTPGHASDTITPELLSIEGRK